MAPMLTWLHLSDLHACNPHTGWDAADVLEDLPEDLARVRDAHGLEPDLIFFTGDAAFGHLGSGDGKSIAEQFEEAEILFTEIRDIFGVAQERFFLVPGNHDVHRGKANGGDTTTLDGFRDDDAVLQLMQAKGAQWTSILRRLEDYREYLERFEYQHLLGSEHLNYTQSMEINGLRVGVAGFNTAWSCCRNGERGKLWWGGRRLVKEMARQLKDCDLRIALTHHPSGWFTEHEDPKVENMLKSRFALRLHGHDHLRIGAGACYATSEAEKGYNFGRFDPETGAVEVWFRRWDETNEGWAPHSMGHGKTSNDGLWRSESLRLLARALPSDDDGEKSEKDENAEKSEEREPSGPESRGVYGRDAEISKLCKALEAKPLLMLYGLPGVGKTALVDEIARASKLPKQAFFIYPETDFENFFGQLAPFLGGAKEARTLSGPLLVSQLRNLRQWGAKAAPRLLHVQQGEHILDSSQRFRDARFGELLCEIAVQVPAVRVVLESRRALPEGVLPAELMERRRIHGLTLPALRGYFSAPQKDHATAWTLDDVDAQSIFERLGGRAQGKNKGGALPLAMRLLGQVAEAVRMAPARVLERRPERFEKDVEVALFNELWEEALSEAEQRMLGLCALYRGEIPCDHEVELLNRVGDGEKQAFHSLLDRCLLSDVTGEELRYVLHRLIGDLTRKRSRESRDDHSVIAEAFLAGVRSLNRRPYVLAAAEGVYHLIAADRWDLLDKLTAELLDGPTLERLRQQSQDLHRREKHDVNRRVLELLVAADPSDHRSHRFLAEAIEKLDGRGAPLAGTHHRLAFEQNSRFAPYVNNWAHYLDATNEPHEALAVLEKAIAVGIDDDHIHSLRGRLLESLGDGATASSWRRAEIEKGTRVAAHYNGEAKYLQGEGRLDEALAVLEKALAAGVDNAYIQSLYASLQRRSGVQA
jgi:Tfp pilus assembly protein PilF